MADAVPYPHTRAKRLDVDEASGGGEILAPNLSLAAAVAAARSGDAKGWNVLFERFHGDVRAYALARLGDWAGADDVTQETFVAAVTSIRNLRDDREPAVQAWFLHICRHKVLDHVRRAARRDRAVDVRPVLEPDPAAVAEGRLRADELRRAMEHLTEDQRDILIRRFVLDHSLEEVAAATGRSTGAVKSMQHRALVALERVIAKRRAA